MSLSVEKSTLAYEERGNGVPVVFIHGLTFERSAWRPVMDRLGNGIRSVAVDLPGHGETPGPPCSLDEAASRLHTLLEQAGVERPVVVGHSMASSIALLYAASHPVRGVVSVDQPVDVRPFARLAQRIEPALRGHGFRAAFEPFQASMGLDQLDEPVRERVLAKQRVEPDLVLGYWEEALRSDPDELQGRFEGALAQIQAPVLFVFGREFEAVDREYLLKQLPQAQLEVWPGRGHFVHLADPDRFTAHLRDFIDDCSRAR
jgi:pimeloyl-ACP methyl ester carboxylesterase